MTRFFVALLFYLAVLSNPALAIPPSADILFNGQVLFKIHATDELTATERAEYINARLEKSFRNIQTKQVIPRINVYDSRGDKILKLNRDHLLTITQSDLDESQYDNLNDLSQSWRTKLKDAFTRTLRESSTAYTKQAIIYACTIFIIALILGLLVRTVRQKINSDFSYLVLLTGIWSIAIGYIIDLFPFTRPLRYQLEQGIFKPFSILCLIIFLYAILSRLLTLSIDYRFRDKISENWSALDRALNKSLTLKQVILTSGEWVLGILAFVSFLVLVGIDLASVLTGAGIFSLVISFLAQDLFRGIINGISIISEDQFGVGDVVQIGKHKGTVENFTLRITQLRNLEGILITIPNKEISAVENFTNNFSQVDFQIKVDYAANLGAALEVMRQVAHDLVADWQDKILAEPEILGVDRLDDNGIVLRMLLRTLPMHQWSVKRELNLRVKEAFEGAKIKISIGQRELVILREGLS